MKVCIIGAGAAGLAAAKVLRKNGISFVIMEKGTDVGGIWDKRRDFSPYHKNLHLISPNSMMQYKGDDFPEEIPDFAGFRYVQSYFHYIVQKYDLQKSIRFNCNVTNIRKKGEKWIIQSGDRTAEQYNYLIIATGMQSSPKLPRLVHDSSIEIIHSVEYNDPSQLIGKNVVVIGGGQSSIDITKDAVITANSVIHSLRQKPCWFPKYNSREKPAENDYFKAPAPFWVKRIVMNLLLRKVHSLPAFAALPYRERVMNAVIDQNHLEHYARYDIIVKSSLLKIDRGIAYFGDGYSQESDLVIAATGYHTEFKFIDRSYLAMKSGDRYPNFFAHTLHPDDHTLFTCGILHPMGGHWPTYELQANLIARAILLSEKKRWAILGKLKSLPQKNCNALSMYPSNPNYPVVEKLTYHRFIKSLLRIA